MKTNFSLPLILASNSPRRRQLLLEAGFDFEVKTYPCSESYEEHIPGSEVAEYLAIRKNQVHREKIPQSVIITADTVVLSGNRVLEKPGNPHEAINMLLSLSGLVHDVITGVCISSPESQVSFSDITRVYFRDLSEQEIHHYVAHFSPMDKAGSYGIQEWIGLIGVPRIEGSFYNVVGLPIERLYLELINNFNINPLQ